MTKSVAAARYDYRNKEMENIRNGYLSKTSYTGMGDMGIFVLRGRKGECDPRIVPRHSNTISRDMEAKIIFVYAKGMTQPDIDGCVRGMYGVDISYSTLAGLQIK